MLTNNCTFNHVTRATRRWIFAAVLGAALLPGLLSAQQQKQQAETLIAATAEVAKILQNVRDASSAQAAKPGLQQAAQALESAAEAFQSGRKGGQVIDKKTLHELDAAHGRLGAAIAAVQKKAPEAAKELKPILTKLSQF